ncbi:malonate--CoA ligase [Leisingera methylohalidivorans]|uniref:Malonyl-CoA synthase n=1 Tax=Leisingera methylohalidivorans DSM 14336 TaxID=999552 RepID=V9W0N3_9RHOB|nr:malonyl-CoA synthase [Leisingera methylohalidivorans]AHD03564.1 malonyl-CoA synthase [Leisingera methylohalidivorans DSM 14336]
MYEQNHLASRLRAASLGREDAPFLHLPASGQTTSYGDFFANAEKLAAVLVDAGVGPGDRIAVQAPKTQTMLELYVASVLAGAVFLPLNTSYTGSELEYFLTDASPRVFVCDPARLESLGPIAAKAGVTKVFTLTADDGGTLAEAKEASSAGFVPVVRGSDDLAAILYTSGTTGRSKGAMLTHGNLASNAETLRDVWKFTRRDVLIHALPIFHTHGLFVATNVTLMAGSACHFFAGFDSSAIMDSLPRATVLMGVPTFYVRLLKEAGLPEATASMRLFISGSAPLLAETHEQWRNETGHAILERYGMTETNMIASNPYDGPRKPGTVGLPLPGVEVLVTDPQSGTPLDQGEVGMLEVRGPNVFGGYWQMPEKTAEELRASGFFVTGDLGQIDGDGYVHIVGREKDLIITGGYNVYPKEIELLIDDLSEVAESAVIGVPHPDFGEGVVAVVVPSPGASLTGEDVLRKISGSVARYKQPKHAVIIDTLPRNTMGKVQKNALREQYSGIFEKSGTELNKKQPAS